MVAEAVGRVAPVRWMAAASLVVAAGLLAGCAPRGGQRPPAPAPAASPQPTLPAGAAVFDVDPARSEVTVLVRRSGPLARLGHNHVLTSGQESGIAWLGDDLRHSGFELRLPVADFVVDDPGSRTAAGAEFPGEVPEEARDGTYRNMLRAEVLDAARYPRIVVQSSGLGGTWERPVAYASVTLRAITRELAIPIAIERDGHSILARGSLRIRQSDFGMAPFSVGGGAIQVADEVEILFEIRAVAR